MNLYILIAIAFVVFGLHYHYYRYGVLSNKANRPVAYRSGLGVLVVVLSKLLLLGIIVIHYEWYYVFVPLVLFFVFKLAIGYLQIFYETKEYAKALGISQKEARAVASQEIKKYYRESSKLI